MGNGIGRLRLQGIALQPTFSSPMPSATHFIPSDETFLIEHVLRKEENKAAMGTDYETVDVKNTTRHARFPLGFKVDEKTLPLFFRQKYDISTTTVEAGVYQHIMRYQDGMQNWFTIFMEDDDRTDYRMQNVLFDGLAFDVKAGEFIMLNGGGQGNYPESGDYTVTAVDPNSFTGVDAAFSADDFGGTATSVAVESVNAKHIFNLSADERNFNIGDDDMAFHRITTARFELDITAKLADREDYDIFTANTSRLYKLVIRDTSRTIGTGTNPSVTLEYPIGKPIAYTDEGDLDTNLLFNATYLALKKPTLADTPMKLTVINQVSGY
jgi:hypothetical protein